MYQYLGLKRLLCLASLLSLAPIVSAQEYTDPVLYHPFSQSPHKKKLVVTKTVNGTCQHQSKIDKRRDAWRCKAKKKIFDPCFQHRFLNKNKLICPTSPWSSQAVQVKAKKTPDNQHHKELDMSRNDPWAVELTNGLRCLQLAKQHSKSQRYFCENNQYLTGNFYRCKSLWEIYLVNNGDYHIAKVKRAWF